MAEKKTGEDGRFHSRENPGELSVDVVLGEGGWVFILLGVSFSSADTLMDGYGH